MAALRGFADDLKLVRRLLERVAHAVEDELVVVGEEDP
jgi:hypothetical protein